MKNSQFCGWSNSKNTETKDKTMVKILMIDLLVELIFDRKIYMICWLCIIKLKLLFKYRI